MKKHGAKIIIGIVALAIGFGVGYMVGGRKNKGTNGDEATK